MSGGRCAALAALAAIAGIAASPGSGQRHYVDRSLGWQISYPDGFRLEAFSTRGRHSSDGVSISNFGSPPIANPFTLETLPADGVLLRIWTDDRSVLNTRRYDTRYPLSLPRFKPFPGQAQPGVSFFQGDGLGYRAAVWTGSQASAGARVALARIVASFRPAPLAPGGVAPRCTAFVLHTNASYRLRSVTFTSRRSLPRQKCLWRRPFYLVHAPRGFDAVAAKTGEFDQSARCNVEFDRKAFEFFCRRNGARWDRAGRILVKPRSGETVTPLWSYFTILAFDRHIMVSPNISSQVHDLW
ncbi:MAG: hypothetical protein M3R39_05115 [Actinomycetota bacterium]|nr:hypothetical protein [Actinomycetota bacterium]